MEIRNRRLPDEAFEQQRKQVLASWPTGREVNFREAVEFQKTLLPGKNNAMKLSKAKENGTMLLRSDCGVPSIEEQTEYSRFVQDEGGSGLLGIIIDSLTRTQKYETARQSLEKCLRTGEHTLNGFPIVEYGVARTRKLIEAVDLPVMLRGVAPDWRLILEIGLASGFTSTSGASFISFSQFSKRDPLETTIRNFQYCYALMGRYQAAGIPMVPEISGGVGVLTPNSVTHAATVADALVAAEQGVKNILVMVHAQGNLAQDVAAMKALPQLCQEYLNRLGYFDVTLTVVSTSWSGQFPKDTSEAMAVICLGATAAVLGGAQVVHVKTVSEATAIPQKEANAASLRAGKKVVDMLKDQSIRLDGRATETEMRMQILETRAIVDRTLELGDGDIVVGAMRAVEAGVMDQVFATNQHIAGRVMGARDDHGAVRYLDHGNLPFGNEITEFHRERLAARRESQGKDVDYESVVSDIFSISRGVLVQR